MTHSQVRQNFHKDCEDAINKQINLELFASYTYLSLAYYFQRDDVALPGHYKYFKSASDEEREHAQLFMEYLNKRGGRILLTTIDPPEKQEWGTSLEAMHSALELEKSVNENLLHLHSVASGHMDVNLCDFLETHYLQEQVDSIKEIADHVTNLKRVGDGLGVFMFDQRISENKC
ncbi:hypothetical protein ABEB36_003995 [Hypothenemus hampei]|uniref:Ferritin n=1 Tax=Hypothenemus hampei TaxID=57062 RepID=A0ABD1F1U7_HYPHA